MTEITINVLELASELADKELERIWEQRGNVGSLLVEDGVGNTTYNENAQDIFNDLYDEYYDLIFKTEIL